MNPSFKSVEDYDTLKKLLHISNSSKDETVIEKVIFGNIVYEIEGIKISVLKDTKTSHLEYGMSLSMDSEPMPYNFRVSVFVKESL